ncbi:MAG: hypothetical protein RI947_113 [Candidatus Parcubacteria bacterium]|jgi:hypothetical protein
MKSIILTTIGTLLILAVTATAIYAVEKGKMPKIAEVIITANTVKNSIKDTVGKLLVMRKTDKPADSIQKKPSLYPTFTPTPTPTKDLWMLKKIEGDSDKDLAALPTDSIKSMVRWQDRLLYHDSKSRTVRMINLTDGTNTLLFDAHDSGIQSKASYGDPKPAILSLKVIDNSLVISVWVQGKYFTIDGATYAMRLDKENKMRKIADYPGYPKQIRSRWFLVRTDGGDTCGGRETFATLDTDTATSTFIAETHMGCSKGEEFIGIDTMDRMIVAYDDGQTGPGGPFFDGLATYKYILAIHLSDPSVKDGLVAEQEMPKGITSIKYDEATNQLLMVGKSVYLFDLTSNVKEKITDLPEDWNTVWVDSHDGPHYCIVHPAQKPTDIQGDKRYAKGGEINIVTKTFIEKSEVCPQEKIFGMSEPPQTAPSKSVEDIVQELQLPSRYVMVKVK